MRRKRFKAILFGPQGSGKSTQGKLLSSYFGVPYFSSGDMFRAEIQEKSALGSMVSEYVGSGMLAPDELVDAIVKKHLAADAFSNGFILDGYPRNVEQAMTLDRLQKIHLAIQIKLTDGEAVKRLGGRLQCEKCRELFHENLLPKAERAVCTVCGGALVKRDDDKEAIIRKRLAAYRFMTEPMARYYRQKGVLLAVNGGQDIEHLFEELVKKTTRLGFTPNH